MLPLVCNDAAAVLFMFDLTQPETLDAIRLWHRKARKLNKCAIPLLVGCKYDSLLEQPPEDITHICTMSRRFAAAIQAPLIFCAPSVPINVTNVFKVILIRLFGLEPAVPILRQPGEPWIIYERVANDAREVQGEAPEGGSTAHGVRSGMMALAPPTPPPPPPPPMHAAASMRSSGVGTEATSVALGV